MPVADFILLVFIIYLFVLDLPPPAPCPGAGALGIRRLMSTLWLLDLTVLPQGYVSKCVIIASLLDLFIVLR